MKRFLHALAVLWPLPTRRGPCEFADLPIREFAKGQPSESAHQQISESATKSESAHLRISASAKENHPTDRKIFYLNRRYCNVLAYMTLFMCLTAAKQVSAQAEPAAAVQNDYRLPAVTSELITDARHLDRIPQFTPDADLERFPVKRYRVQTDSTFKGLRIGDAIPDTVWKLPLWIVNHPDGKDTVTLQDYRDSKLLVLDFWARFCTPCMESMDKWEGYMEQLDGEVQLIGAQLDFDYKALPTIREKWWQSPTVIGEGAYLLNRLFFQRDVISRMVWIRDGKLLAITSGRGYDMDTVSAAAAGQPVDIPIDPLLIYPSPNPITD